MNISRFASFFRTAVRASGAAFAIALLAGATAPAQQAPEFTHSSSAEWINSKPLKLEDFSGRVLLIDVWAFECWNCFHSFPWLKSVEAKFGAQGLALLGVHSPEFPNERVRDNVVAKVKEFGLKHPVMLDNDFSYWKALDNQYWPAYYVVDKQGRVRGRFVGETHADDAQARKIEALIVTLTKEKN
jgi:glutathione peroxidase-family protein